MEIVVKFLLPPPQLRAGVYRLGHRSEDEGGFPTLTHRPESGEVRAAAAHQVFAPIIYLTFAPPPPPWAPPAAPSTKHARKRLLSSEAEEAYLSKVFLTVSQGFRKHCPMFTVHGQMVKLLQRHSENMQQIFLGSKTL